MATTTTSTANFSTLVTDLVLRRSQEILAAKYVHLGTGAGFNRATIIKGTNQLRFPAVAQLAAVTTALSEGSPPTAQELTISSDTVSAVQYGWTAEITDLAMLESPLDMIAIAADRIADQAGNSLDVVVRDIIGAGTAVKYSNGAARSAVSATITGALVKKMFWYLVDSNVPRFGDSSYHAILSPEQGYDLETDTSSGGWMDVHRYNSASSNLLTGEIGQYAGVRFMVTSNATVSARPCSIPASRSCSSIWCARSCGHRQGVLRFATDAATCAIAGRLMPRWEFECIETPRPKVAQVRAVDGGRA